MPTDKSGDASERAKVTIFEVTLRPWGELVTDARRASKKSPAWRGAEKLAGTAG
jgi:hypothetical protein